MRRRFSRKMESDSFVLEILDCLLRKRYYFLAFYVVVFARQDLNQFHIFQFLRVTGRIKEQFKLQNGKFVVPAPLEDSMCRSPFIAQSFLFGDNKEFTIILVVPDVVAVRGLIIYVSRLF